MAARHDDRRRRHPRRPATRTSTLTPDPAPRGSAPAQLWLVDGGPATVGIIASVSHAFCSACDRTRLTADGQVRSCLFAREETDLRALMRAGADDDAVEAAWRAAMWAKAAGPRHQRPGLRAAGPPDERDRRLTWQTTTTDGDGDRPLLRRGPRAAGAEAEVLCVAPGTTVGGARRHSGRARVPSWPGCCSGVRFCATGSRSAIDAAALTNGQTVDVLPPFAGG